LTGTLTDAYLYCENVTKTEARNFYYGIRLLPADKRSVLCAVYALARRVDDIGDGDLPTGEKLEALGALRTDLAGLDGSTDPVLVAVADAARRFPLPLGAFTELIDGVEMDVTGRTYATFADLVEYCRCVAGSVGRLCLGVFGSKPHPQAAEYADVLGIALQQTNILRDIREDLGNGRIYLPQEDLDRFGVIRADLAPGRTPPQVRELLAFEVARTRRLYAEAEPGIDMLHPSSRDCIRTAFELYRGILGAVEKADYQVLDRRVGVPLPRRFRVAVPALVRARRARGRPTTPTS